MPNYTYSAKDKTGKTLSGVLDMPDEKSVISSLREQGLIPVSVGIEKTKKKVSIKGRLGGRIALGELVLFSRQMATLIDAGIPLVQGLDILTEQIENKSFKAVVMTVKEDVAAGASLNEALGRHPRAFSPLFVNMVRAGESSGALDDIMERLATYLEKTDSLLRKVRSAMIYPCVVATMAVAITLVLMIYVIPVFKSMFADLGGELPLATRILVAISDFLIHFMIIWVSAVVAGITMLVRFIRTKRGREMFDTFKLKVPIFGTIIRKVAVSKFSRTLATLLKSGVPILTALEIVGKSSGNVVIERAVQRVKESIHEGENISGPLMRSKVFPPLVVRMIAVGEQTGELEKMLTKIADFSDDQVDAAVSGLTSLIEPLIIAFLGIVIGGIVICMFLPIFKISTLVSN